MPSGGASAIDSSSAGRTEHALLDEIVAVTKLHRKAVIRLLRQAPRLTALTGNTLMALMAPILSPPRLGLHSGSAR
jgi:hypothetical protein